MLMPGNRLYMITLFRLTISLTTTVKWCHLPVICLLPVPSPPVLLFHPKELFRTSRITVVRHTLHVIVYLDQTSRIRLFWIVKAKRKKLT